MDCRHLFLQPHTPIGDGARFPLSVIETTENGGRCVPDRGAGNRVLKKQVMGLKIVLAFVASVCALSAKDMAAMLGKGINVGNTLDAPHEGDWAGVAQEYFFDDYKKVGFKHVRIPVRWDAHTSWATPFSVSSAQLSPFILTGNASDRHSMVGSRGHCRWMGDVARVDRNHQFPPRQQLARQQQHFLE